MTTFQQWAESDTAPWTKINEAISALSAAGIYSKRAPATTGLTWAFHGGLYNGATIADGTVTLTNAATNYVVFLRSTGVVSTSTSSANSVNPLYAKLYQLTTAGSVVTAEVDQRWDTNGLFFSGGSTTAANIPAQRYVIELLNTTDSDPGPGLIKFNNATPASATALYIDDSTSDGVDLSTYFAGLGATGYITIQSTGDAGEWVIFRWTAITDQTGYFRFTVTAYASLGTLDDADAVFIAFDSDAAGSVSRVGMAFEKELMLSDLTTAITTGTTKAYWRPAFAATGVSARASLRVASSSGIPTVDLNKAGVTMMSTKLTIDASELTSLTAATPVVMSVTTWAIDDLLEFDIDVAGTGAMGLMVTVTGLYA